MHRGRGDMTSPRPHLSGGMRMTSTVPARKPRVRKAVPVRERWTLDKKAEFLRHLSLTANVAASARAVGMAECCRCPLPFCSSLSRTAFRVVASRRAHLGFARCCSTKALAA